MLILNSGGVKLGGQIDIRVQIDWVCKQSHYREVPRWEIFMEQELRFGLDLGRLALLKK